MLLLIQISLVKPKLTDNTIKYTEQKEKFWLIKERTVQSQLQHWL